MVATLKQLRELVQTYLVIAFTIIEVVLITRFLVDFLGYQKENVIINILKNLSSFFLIPFERSFDQRIEAWFR